jgi:hypothetical protein
MILAWTAAATLAQAAILGLTLSHPVFCGAEGTPAVSGDVRIYQRFTDRAMDGQVPYRDYLVEYPPLAMPLFLLPRLVSGGAFRPFLAAFGLEMLAFNALAVWLMARRVADREGLRAVPRRLAWYTASFAALCPLLIGRYDLAPMAICYAAVVLWSRERRGAVAGGILAAVGVLMKIFPGVILAPAMAWELSRGRGGRFRGLIAFTATMLVGVAAWYAVGRQGMVASLEYHTGRGLEIGSTYAGLTMLDGLWTGAPLRTVFTHSSNGVEGPWSDVFSRMALTLQVLALGVVAWRSWRLGPDGDPFRLAAAALLAFIVFGKVLSPQYMIWLFPFVATLPGRDGTRARALFVLCCVLTTMIYPWAIHRLMRFESWSVGLLVYRNILLLGLWGLLLAERVPATAAAEEPLTEPGTGSLTPSLQVG